MNTTYLTNKFLNNNIEEFRKFEELQNSNASFKEDLLRPILFFDSDNEIEEGYYSFEIEEFSFNVASIRKQRLNPSSPIFGYSCEGYFLTQFKNN